MILAFVLIEITGTTFLVVKILDYLHLLFY